MRRRLKIAVVWMAWGAIACGDATPTQALDAGTSSGADTSGLSPVDAGAALADGGVSPLGDAGVTGIDTGFEQPADAGGAEASRALRPGVEELIIDQTVDGEVVGRRVLLQSPRQIDPEQRYPVVFFFHGNGGRPDGYVGQMRPFMNQGRFVAVLPEGLERSWNLGPERSKADDLAFVDLIVARLRSYRGLNFDRVFAMGYSNGSGLVQYLMGHRRHFRAGAMAASALSPNRLPRDEVRTASILQLHGTEDAVCPYEGGNSRVGHAFLHAEESGATWAQVMGCPRDAQETETSDRNRRFEWGPCREGHRVVHYGYVGAGHGLPRDQEGGMNELIVRFFEETP